MPPYMLKSQVSDRIDDRIGFRYFRVDPEKGFFLNGEHLPLKGVCRHQDRAEIGNALLPPASLVTGRSGQTSRIQLTGQVVELCDVIHGIVPSLFQFIKQTPETNGGAIGISEYGAGASILHQQEDLVKPVANSYWHPENWQTYFHEEHWKAIDNRPFLWGTFVWNMFDFGAAHRREGELNGKNDKGLVTFDRKVKKDAFYFYKANWNRENSFVYIAGRRLTKRSGALQSIKVYSNQPLVELCLNGRSLGKKKGEYGTFVWNSVKLNRGKNEIVARTQSGDEDKILLAW